MLIEFAVPGDRNVIKKEAGMILKHNDFVHLTCDVKSKVIPVITGATGTTATSTK